MGSGKDHMKPVEWQARDGEDSKVLPPHRKRPSYASVAALEMM